MNSKFFIALFFSAVFFFSISESAGQTKTEYYVVYGRLLKDGGDGFNFVSKVIPVSCSGTHFVKSRLASWYKAEHDETIEISATHEYKTGSYDEAVKHRETLIARQREKGRDRYVSLSDRDFTYRCN